ncbi:hypothetical protein QUH73_15090 [Labilibaculum sp. K2S]|uniref:hypothetical protein n=1 Tax=Labilibaculum sp. K2S TaxID=3056386 RepID=UPI0025A3606D|nr:hypothetical protein [Labilibaculum sp. K2S]MDM8161149.1 hypothetical protein [Labilibaculum sp. K2S]
MKALQLCEFIDFYRVLDMEAFIFKKMQGFVTKWAKYLKIPEKAQQSIEFINMIQNMEKSKKGLLTTT